MAAIEPAENRGETAAPLAVVRGRPFLPGNTGNGGGRPKGLAELVRRETKDGAELVRFMLRILRGQKQPLRYRLEAAAWLADRGFGKALQQVEVGNADGEPFTHRILIDYVTEGRDPDADGAAE